MSRDIKAAENLGIDESEAGVILEVFVKTRSREFKITVEGGEIVVFCEEDPIRGRVNRELVKEFSKLLDRKVELVSGFASRRKKLFIKDARKSEIRKILLHEQ